MATSLLGVIEDLMPQRNEKSLRREGIKARARFRSAFLTFCHEVCATMTRPARASYIRQFVGAEPSKIYTNQGLIMTIEMYCYCVFEGCQMSDEMMKLISQLSMLDFFSCKIFVNAEQTD